MDIRRCPNCRAARSETASTRALPRRSDPGAHGPSEVGTKFTELVPGAAAECSECGIVFAKWKGDQTIGRPTGRTLGQTVSSGPSRIVRPDALASMVAVAGRGLLWLGLVAWTWWFITRPMGPAVFDSFLHVVDLVFHEAGHLLFSPDFRFGHGTRPPGQVAAP